MNLTVTDLAQERLTTLLADRETNPAQAIRIFAQGGGCACSGPQFGMGLDQAGTDDEIVQVGKFMFVVDPQSAPVLEGASIDYVDDIMRSGFAIEAPNAPEGGSCGCGGH